MNHFFALSAGDHRAVRQPLLEMQPRRAARLATTKTANPVLVALTSVMSAGLASDLIQSLSAVSVARQRAARVVMLTQQSAIRVLKVTTSTSVKVLALSAGTVSAIARLATRTSADVRLVVLVIDWICSLATARLALHLIALHAAVKVDDAIHARRASCSMMRLGSALLVLYPAARAAPKIIPCVIRASGRTTGQKWMVEQYSRQMVS